MRMQKGEYIILIRYIYIYIKLKFNKKPIKFHKARIDLNRNSLKYVESDELYSTF